jgi:hypothetical protein
VVQQLLAGDHEGVFYGLVDVDFLEFGLGLPREFPEVIHDFLDPVVAFPDKLQALSFRPILGKVLHHHVQNGLGGHERVVELVGHARHQFPRARILEASTRRACAALSLASKGFCSVMSLKIPAVPIIASSSFLSKKKGREDGQRLAVHSPDFHDVVIRSFLGLRWAMISLACSIPFT